MPRAVPYVDAIIRTRSQRQEEESLAHKDINDAGNVVEEAASEVASNAEDLGHKAKAKKKAKAAAKAKRARKASSLPGDATDGQDSAVTALSSKAATVPTVTPAPSTNPAPLTTTAPIPLTTTAPSTTTGLLAPVVARVTPANTPSTAVSTINSGSAHTGQPFSLPEPLGEDDREDMEDDDDEDNDTDNDNDEVFGDVDPALLQSLSHVLPKVRPKLTPEQSKARRALQESNRDKFWNGLRQGYDKILEMAEELGAENNRTTQQVLLKWGLGGHTLSKKSAPNSFNDFCKHKAKILNDAIRERNTGRLLTYANARASSTCPDEIPLPELEPLVKVVAIAQQFKEEYGELKANAKIEGPDGDAAREELECYKTDVEEERQETKTIIKDGRAVVHDMNSVWSKVTSLLEDAHTRTRQSALLIVVKGHEEAGTAPRCHVDPTLARFLSTVFKLNVDKVAQAAERFALSNKHVVGGDMPVEEKYSKKGKHLKGSVVAMIRDMITEASEEAEAGASYANPYTTYVQELGIEYEGYPLPQLLPPSALNGPELEVIYDAIVARTFTFKKLTPERLEALQEEHAILKKTLTTEQLETHPGIHRVTKRKVSPKSIENLRNRKQPRLDKASLKAGAVTNENTTANRREPEQPQASADNAKGTPAPPESTSSPHIPSHPNLTAAPSQATSMRLSAGSVLQPSCQINAMGGSTFLSSPIPPPVSNTSGGYSNQNFAFPAVPDVPASSMEAPSTLAGFDDVEWDTSLLGPSPFRNQGQALSKPGTAPFQNQVALPLAPNDVSAFNGQVPSLLLQNYGAGSFHGQVSGPPPNNYGVGNFSDQVPSLLPTGDYQLRSHQYNGGEGDVEMMAYNSITNEYFTNTSTYP